MTVLLHEVKGIGTLIQVHGQRASGITQLIYSIFKRGALTKKDVREARRDARRCFQCINQGRLGL